MPPDENMSIPLDHNVSILLVSNMYNWNIRTFYYTVEPLIATIFGDQV